MHFIVAWEIDKTKVSIASAERKLRIHLNQFSWVRPLEQDLYIVQAKSQTQWVRLFKGLTSVAESYPEDSINFIMSPLMAGGAYDGLLKEDLWVEINNITG